MEVYIAVLYPCSRFAPYHDKIHSLAAARGRRRDMRHIVVRSVGGSCVAVIVYLTSRVTSLGALLLQTACRMHDASNLQYLQPFSSPGRPSPPINFAGRGSSQQQRRHAHDSHRRPSNACHLRRSSSAINHGRRNSGLGTETHSRRRRSGIIGAREGARDRP